MTRENLIKTLESVIKERTEEVCATIRAIAASEESFLELGSDEKTQERRLEHNRCMTEYLRRARMSRARLEDELEYCLTNPDASVGDVIRGLSMR